MLKKVTLKNFRAFANLEIDLEPITLIFGPNNSGKSSILSSLCILAQTIESADQSAPLLLNGYFGDYGTYKDLIYKNISTRPLDIGITAKNALDEKDVSVNLTYKWRSVRRELILKKCRMLCNGKDLSELNYSESTESNRISKIGNQELPDSYKNYIHMFHFLPHIRTYDPLNRRRKGASNREELGADSGLDREKLESDIVLHNRSVFALLESLRSIDYVGALRSAPERTYLYSGERRRRIGSRGQNASTILALDAGVRAKTRESLIDLSSRWLRSAGIAKSISIKTLTDRHYEIRVEHPETGEIQNIADVGYGASQILPILIGGYSLNYGSIFLVEEPEIHLHPKAQAELGSFFIDLFKRKGIQSIIETHSEYLIIRMLQHIARGDIEPEKVAVYYVYPENGNKTITKLRVNDRGVFIDEWPQGFFPERMDEATKLARIRAEKSNED